MKWVGSSGIRGSSYLGSCRAGRECRDLCASFSSNSCSIRWVAVFSFSGMARICSKRVVVPVILVVGNEVDFMGSGFAVRARCGWMVRVESSPVMKAEDNSGAEAASMSKFV